MQDQSKKFIGFLVDHVSWHWNNAFWISYYTSSMSMQPCTTPSCGIGRRLLFAMICYSFFHALMKLLCMKYNGQFWRNSYLGAKAHHGVTILVD
jgi:hypothetical protein